MKKFVMAISVLIIMASNVNAESPTDKGVYNLSGTISYSRTNSGGGTTLSVNPAFFYFVYPNLAIGATISYGYFKTDEDELKSYGIGPVIRYYFGKEMIHPFLSLEYVYSRDEIDNTFSAGSPYVSTGHSHVWTPGLGIDYFIAKNVALEPVIRYTFDHSFSNASGFGITTSSNTRTETLFIGIGINVFIY